MNHEAGCPFSDTEARSCVCQTANPLEVVQRLQRELDQAVHLRIVEAKEVGLEVSCSRGCSACCHQHVWVHAAEAELIATHVQQEMPEMVDEFVARAEAQLDAATSMSRREFWTARVPCFLLDVATNECRVHEVRPAQCRGYHSLGPPEECDRRPARPKSIRMLNHRDALNAFGEALSAVDHRGVNLLPNTFLTAISPVPRVTPWTRPSCGRAADFCAETLLIDHVWFAHEGFRDHTFMRALMELNRHAGEDLVEGIRSTSMIEVFDRSVRQVLALTRALHRTRAQKANARAVLAAVVAAAESIPCSCPGDEGRTPPPPSALEQEDRFR